MTDPNNVTQISKGIYVCDDCGAHAEDPTEIEHYPTCEPGSSRRWQELHNELPEEEKAR